MDDLISRQMAISAIVGMTTMGFEELVIAGDKEKYDWIKGLSDSLVRIINLPSAEPKIVRCCKCGFWDRDTLRHQFNDFRDWNEAECKILAERDPYHEINRYTEADDFCSYAERRTDGET